MDRIWDRKIFSSSVQLVLLELLAIAFATSQNHGTVPGPVENGLKYYGNLKGTKIIEMYRSECHVFVEDDASWIRKTRGSNVTLLNPVQFELLVEKCNKNRASHNETSNGEDEENRIMNNMFSSTSSSDTSTTPPSSGSDNNGNETETTSETPLIFPGTKWCGRGDIARSYDDIGLYAHTDRCCRDHDNCFDNIPAGGEKHGLHNNASFTSSHCDCEDNFLNCLRSDGTLSKLTSTKIAHIYFNILKPLCFAERHPVVSCQKTRITGECIRPEYDYRQAREWQFFPAQQYIAKTVRGLLDTFSNVFGATEAPVDDPTSQSGRRSAAMPPGFSF